MSRDILPGLWEVRDLVAHPDSVTRRLVGDPRMILMTGYALTLQTAHPTVSNVAQGRSRFKDSAWARLVETIDFVQLLTFGSPAEVRATGEFVRNMHKGLEVRLPDGRRQYALDPDAYNWVHASLAYALVKGYRTFVGEVSDADAERFWQEWRSLGRVIGIRDRGRDTDLPETWLGLERYVDRMCRERLEQTQTASDVLGLFAGLPRPDRVPGMLDAYWNLLRWEPSRVWSLATVGLLGPQMRQRLGAPWTPVVDDIRFATLREATRRLPGTGDLFPSTYRKVRDGAMRRSYLQSLEISS